MAISPPIMSSRYVRSARCRTCGSSAPYIVFIAGQSLPCWFGT
jgi:hypothetical protein